MNEEEVNKRRIYEICMQQTTTREYFEHCNTFLSELVSLAGTSDPCTMLRCDEPKVTCAVTDRTGCHVTHFNGTYQSTFSPLGMDKDGNIFNPKSQFENLEGLGPGDFKPGQKPFHSSIPRPRRPLPLRYLKAGHLVGSNEPKEPVTTEEIKAAEEKKINEAKLANERFENQTPATPVVLAEVKIQ
jgi:hypothetical protein